MFSLISGRHVDAHQGGTQHGVSILRAVIKGRSADCGVRSADTEDAESQNVDTQNADSQNADSPKND